MQFVGWALASCFLPRLSDIYGRKYVYVGSMVLQLLGMIATFFSTSVEATTAIMFFLGFSGVGRCSICFLYLMELLPTNRQTFLGTLLQMNNGTCSIYMAVYFWFISKNWVWIEAVAVVMTLVCIIGGLLLPESPKFLMGKMQWGKARGALSYIGKFNGAGTFTGRFDRE